MLTPSELAWPQLRGGLQHPKMRNEVISVGQFPPVAQPGCTGESGPPYQSHFSKGPSPAFLTCLSTLLLLGNQCSPRN